MKLSPGEDESELSSSEIAIDDLKVVDADLGFSFGVTRMEMREAMIIEEHRDRDPEEATDRRHGTDDPAGSGRLERVPRYVPRLSRFCPDSTALNSTRLSRSERACAPGPIS